MNRKHRDKMQRALNKRKNIAGGIMLSVNIPNIFWEEIKKTGSSSVNLLMTHDTVSFIRRNYVSFYAKRLPESSMNKHHCQFCDNQFCEYIIAVNNKKMILCSGCRFTFEKVIEFANMIEPQITTSNGGITE